MAQKAALNIIPKYCVPPGARKGILFELVLFGRQAAETTAVAVRNGWMVDCRRNAGLSRRCTSNATGASLVSIAIRANVVVEEAIGH